MIKSSSNKLALLVEKAIIKSTNKRDMREQIVKDIAELVGDPNTKRINGILNGSYEIKLMDAIAIMKYFHLEDIADVIDVSFGTHKTFAALQKRQAA